MFNQPPGTSPVTTVLLGKISTSGLSPSAEAISLRRATIAAADTGSAAKRNIWAPPDLDLTTMRGRFSALICSATSEPHLKAIAGEVQERLKEDHHISAAAVDGFPASQRIVLDYLQVRLDVRARWRRFDVRPWLIQFDV